MEIYYMEIYYMEIEGKSVFYNHYFVKGIKYTKDLLFDRTDIDSFNTLTGLRHAVPSNLRVNIPDFKAVFDLKCRDYYGYLIKKTYERPRKWTKIGEEFNLIDDLISRAYLLPIRVASEPYFKRSFQYKVLNSILYTNDILYKIGFVSDPNCCFCKRTKRNRKPFFNCSFSHSFWSEVTAKILKKLGSCKCLLLCDVMKDRSMRS